MNKKLIQHDRRLTRYERVLRRLEERLARHINRVNDRQWAKHEQAYEDQQADDLKQTIKDFCGRR